MLTGEQIKPEMALRKSRRANLLVAFEEKGELYTGDLLEIAGTGMSSRLKELKRKGHIILSSYEAPGLWRYTYIGNKDDN